MFVCTFVAVPGVPEYDVPVSGVMSVVNVESCAGSTMFVGFSPVNKLELVPLLRVTDWHV
jgi:hypothetical protein